MEFIFELKNADISTRRRVEEVLEPFVNKVMLSNPSNVAEFGYEYFKALRVQRDDQRRDNRSRLTIIGESFDPTTDRFVFNEKFAKSAKDRQLVLQIIPQIFMFSQCSTDELNMILKLMKSTKFNRNSDIISKDEFVSNFYIVYECVDFCRS